MDKITVEINDLSKVSDGYHTIQELYEHRYLLFIALMNAYPQISWYSDKHFDGSIFDGWFIAGMDLNGKQITYHLEKKYCYLISNDILCLDRANEFDGHNSNDVLQRLKNWLVK